MTACARPTELVLSVSVARFMFGLVFLMGSACHVAALPAKLPGYGSHFDGENFYNVPWRPDEIGLLDIIEWRLSREVGPWDGPHTRPSPWPRPPARTEIGETRVTFVNHATVLIQIDGFNIITDPVYVESVGPSSLTSEPRVRPPGISFQDLPTIHAVLISHNHYDHLCLETLGRIHARDEPTMFVGLLGAELLAAEGIASTHELDWWQSHPLTKDVRVTFVPAQHFSSRGIFDQDETLWGGFVVEGSKHTVYFAGDTGEGPHFQQIRERLGPPDLALLPIGAFRPVEIMRPVHLTPDDAVVAHQQLEASASMAIHYGTFALADDGQYEPIELLARALADHEIEPEQFWVLDFGEGRNLQTLSDPAAAKTTPPASPAP